MSASREKKQRRTTDAPLLSPRAQEEAKKLVQRKRKTVIYSIIGVVAVILIAALLIWHSGVFQRNAAIATINGEKVTAPQVMYYYYSNDIISNAQLYAQVGISHPYYSLESSPKDQIITEAAVSALGLDESYTGKTYHELFVDEALEALSQQYAVCAAAKAAGYTLSDEGKASVQQAMESLDSYRESYMANYGINVSRTAYLKMMYGDLMTESAYRSCLENAYLFSEYYETALNTLANYSEQELDAYYQENKLTLDTFSYYWRYFDGTAASTTDEDGNTVAPTDEETEAAMDDAKDDAEAALDELLDARDPVAAAAADENMQLASGPNLSEGSFYYDFLTDPARQPGDGTVLEGSSGYYVVIFADRYLDASPTMNIRHILVSAMPKDDPATEDVDESAEAPSDADYEAAKAEAERILAEWQNGAATEDSFAALAEQYSVDSVSNTNGGLYSKVVNGQTTGSFNDEIFDWIFDSARKPGDVSGPIQNTNSEGWHIVYYVGEDEPAWVTTVRQTKWVEDMKANTNIERTSKLDTLI